jgi:hypothetical protein
LAELHSLVIGIRKAPGDAFGHGSMAYRQFSAACEFGIDYLSDENDVAAPTIYLLLLMIPRTMPR